MPCCRIAPNHPRKLTWCLSPRAWWKTLTREEAQRTQPNRFPSISKTSSFKSQDSSVAFKQRNEVESSEKSTLVFVMSWRFDNGYQATKCDRKFTTKGGYVSGKVITLPGHSDLSKAVTVPCWLQLFAVLGSLGINIFVHIGKSLFTYWSLPYCHTVSYSIVKGAISP
jgi:hypothetical protein